MGLSFKGTELPCMEIYTFFIDPQSKNISSSGTPEALIHWSG